MSYDISFTIDTGGEEPASVGHDYLNYTSNVGNMFCLALDDPKGLRSLHDQLCGSQVNRLQAAVKHMEAPLNEARYLAMNPPNGWGDFPGALGFLKEILENCVAHPKATIQVHA